MVEFGRRPIIAAALTCVECFYSPFNVMPPICLAMASWLLINFRTLQVMVEFGRRPIIVAALTYVECFSSPFNVMPHICLAMASWLANKFSNSTSDG